MFFAKTLKLVFGASLLLGAQLTLPAADEASNTKDESWCAITTPKTFAQGEPFEVKVDLKGLSEKAKLSVNIHYSKKDGSWAGYLYAGQMPAKNVEKDGPEVFECKVSKIPEDFSSIHALVFLSPDGSWEKHSKEARSSKITLAPGR